MKHYPKYIKTTDGYIGTLYRFEYGLFPIYRFESGERLASNWEIEHGFDDDESLKGETYESTY